MGKVSVLLVSDWRNLAERCLSLLSPDVGDRSRVRLVTVTFPALARILATYQA